MLGDAAVGVDDAADTGGVAVAAAVPVPGDISATSDNGGTSYDIFFGEWNDDRVMMKAAGAHNRVCKRDMAKA